VPMQRWLHRPGAGAVRFCLRPQAIGRARPTAAGNGGAAAGVNAALAAYYGALLARQGPWAAAAAGTTGCWRARARAAAQRDQQQALAGSGGEHQCLSAQADLPCCAELRPSRGEISEAQSLYKRRPGGCGRSVAAITHGWKTPRTATLGADRQQPPTFSRQTPLNQPTTCWPGGRTSRRCWDRGSADQRASPTGALAPPKARRRRSPWS